MVFKILAQKYPNKTLLIPNLGIFTSLQNLQIDKFEDGDMKYDNSF